MCWDEGITNTNTAHHRVYGETRARFDLGAQLAVCARAKAVEAIKAVETEHPKDGTCPQFGPRGSVRYDARTYRLMSLDRISLNTLDGRVVCRLVLGARQHAMLVDATWQVGGADLVWRAGVYYLHVTQSQDAPPQAAPDRGTLGVDLGIVNLATDSDGERFSGAQVQTVRAHYHLRRQRLQKVGTKNAKRRLRQIRGHEARFQKAAWAGVPVHLVDPRNTSRTCSRCGHYEKANRKSQESFLCQRCGFALNADENAAINISRKQWAVVNRPLAAALAGQLQAPPSSRGC